MWLQRTLRVDQPWAVRYTTYTARYRFASGAWAIVRREQALFQAMMCSRDDGNPSESMSSTRGTWHRNERCERGFGVALSSPTSLSSLQNRQRPSRGDRVKKTLNTISFCTYTVVDSVKRWPNDFSNFPVLPVRLTLSRDRCDPVRSVRKVRTRRSWSFHYDIPPLPRDKVFPLFCVRTAVDPRAHRSRLQAVITRSRLVRQRVRVRAPESVRVSRSVGARVLHVEYVRTRTV